ncbi:MAG: aminoglycoside phosphotransferase family protein [Anaerolineales bacterium]|nr:aminoglycoside phosphotransferase family protein [Anaerolineales bacterium]
MNTSLTPLSPQILDWIRAISGSASQVSAVKKLSGSTSTTLYRLDISRGAQTLPLVLRLFDNPEWLAEEPELARHEASNLQMVSKAEIAAPELVGFDETGEFCGVPAILMTRVPGEVNLLPKDTDAWLYEIAAAIQPLHHIEIDSYLWEYFPYNDVSQLQVPPWTDIPEAWARAIEIVQGPWPDFRPCFIHRDYHPMNVLWQGEHLSGIVDWPNACRGPAGIDLIWCRNNLSAMYGIEIADRFLDAFIDVAGSSFTYDPFWDLLGIIETLPGPPDVYEPWLEFGLDHLTPELDRIHLEQYLQSVLACI